LRPFAKWLLLISSVATGVTGLLYFWMDRMLEPMGEFAAINHPLQPFVLKAHIIVAPVLVFALGVIGVDHIWKYFRGTMHRARRSGVSATWVIVPMIVTGYFIQAVTAPLWLDGLAWVHIATGTFYLVAVAVHQLVVRRLRLVSLEVRVRTAPADEREVPPPRGKPPVRAAERRERRVGGARSGNV
jgi:hypothetical protein